MSHPQHDPLMLSLDLELAQVGNLLCGKKWSPRAFRNASLAEKPTHNTTIHTEDTMPKDIGPAEFIAAMLSAGATTHLSNPTDDLTAEERIADALEKLADKDD